jgi:flagellar biosynthetic protein FliR
VAVAFPTDWLVAILLASVRIAAWLVVAPPFSSRAVPGVVKALLSVALALPLAPAVREELPPLDVVSLGVALAWQVVVGGGLGFVCYLLFIAFQTAGDLLDLSGGFALTFAFDPFMQAMNSVLGRFYALVATTLLIVTDAWLLIWRALLASFRILPLDATLDPARLAVAVRDGMGEMALVSLQIAGPLLSVLLLADVGLGLATRIAPQLNAFANGFPLKILLTLALLGFSLASMPSTVVAVAERIVVALGEVLA